MIVYLIGMRASGKTTVGSNLAKKLNWNFIDLDNLIVKRAKSSIAEFVADMGWDAFRDLECECLRSVDVTSDIIVSTGGGIILRSENRHFMTTSGEVFYLEAPVQTLYERLVAENKLESRPSLTNKNGPLDELDEVYKDRKELYEGTAEYVINATKPISGVVTEIYNHIVGKGGLRWLD